MNENEKRTSSFANSSSPRNTLGRITVELQAFTLFRGIMPPLESTRSAPTFAYFTHFSLHLPASSRKYSTSSPRVSRWLSVIEQSRGKTFDYRWSFQVKRTSDRRLVYTTEKSDIAFQLPNKEKTHNGFRSIISFSIIISYKIY